MGPACASDKKAGKQHAARPRRGRGTSIHGCCTLLAPLALPAVAPASYCPPHSQISAPPPCRFDIRAFYTEVRRLLKPSGTLAVWGYGLAQFPPQQAAANTLLKRLYDDKLGPYWDAKRVLVEEHYIGLEPSAEEFRVVQREELQMVLRHSLEELVRMEG